MPSTLLFVSGEPGCSLPLCSFPACVLRRGRFSDVKALAQRSHPSCRGDVGAQRRGVPWGPPAEACRLGLGPELGSLGTWVTGVSDFQKTRGGMAGPIGPALSEYHSHGAAIRSPCLLRVGEAGPRPNEGKRFLVRVSCVRAGVEKVQASYSDRFPKFLPEWKLSSGLLCRNKARLLSESPVPPQLSPVELCSLLFLCVSQALNRLG